MKHLLEWNVVILSTQWAESALWKEAPCELQNIPKCVVSSFMTLYHLLIYFNTVWDVTDYASIIWRDMRGLWRDQRKAKRKRVSGLNLSGVQWNCKSGMLPLYRSLQYDKLIFQYYQQVQRRWHVICCPLSVQCYIYYPILYNCFYVVRLVMVLVGCS
jgi:hypothetical protein